MIKDIEKALPLCQELEEWCKSQNLPYIRADDLAAKGYLTSTQKHWLEEFRARWELLKVSNFKFEFQLLSRVPAAFKVATRLRILLSCRRP